MILKLLKNLTLALLLDAGTAPAFNTEDTSPATIAPQSCALPVPGAE
jgi:hypothetical protein